MKKLLLLLLTLVIAGCAAAAKTENAASARDAAMDAATARMVVTRGNDVPGHPQYVTLGKVQGRCTQNPEANDIIPSGDNLRQAAYRKYGTQVDAIVGASSVHISNQLITDPGTTEGYFECEGTAVHFPESQ